jgi:YidC/Oxa1 family membrane protein insertase
VNSDLLLEAKGSIPMATEEDAKTLLKTFSDATSKPNATIVTINEKVSTSNAPRPLITSSLQQEASSLHGYNPKSTMQCAQKLYEAGLITYMRTDNALLSQEACYSIRKQVEEDFGKEYVGFFGQYMIKDLSAPDPTTILNLFGLLPFEISSSFNLGIWPILMGATMVIQQKLSPPPADPTQAKILKFMPYGLTIVLAAFPAGLVIYWTWSNSLSILQQIYINRKYKK